MWSILLRNDKGEVEEMPRFYGTGVDVVTLLGTFTDDQKNRLVSVGFIPQGGVMEVAEEG